MTEIKPLRKQFREQLEQERLNDRQFESMQQLLESKGGNTAKSRSVFSQWRPVFIAAAAALLLIVSGYYFFSFTTLTGNGNPIAVALAGEVATNHLKIQQLDVESSSIAQIRQSLDRLDFAPVLSAATALGDFSLEGGRYCTLQGKIAAQLKLTSTEGERITNYQAAYNPSTFGDLPVYEKHEEPITINKRGVEIRIWVEKGILMAEARTGS